ncbi:hypothetical protein KY290_006829 [Solanum tuberosum]|uniref:Retrotransposon Copia-like N-terminal domain-containing protein n=1 Tax=Solanum tuberosum TaxID=4113 RepID=A0ABQ7WI32_SOLTU|nr:hypothetical protein KY290_006829 [Solanum tuberosum]
MAIEGESSEATGANVHRSGLAANPRSMLDSFDPLFLQNSDIPGVNLAHCVLTGMENYTIWSKTMRIALLGKNKIGFVDGTCRKDMYESLMAQQWERVNAVVLSWIISAVSKDLVNGIVYSSNAHKVWADLQERFDKVNATKIYHVHRGIATLTQGTSSISVYFSKLKELWEEYESLVAPPSCSCDKSRDFISNLEQQKLMQFLGGLNETYNQSRSQILMMPSIPFVNQAYSLIIHEESQRAHLSAAAQTSHLRPHYEEGESSTLAATVMKSNSYSKGKSVMASHYEDGESSGSAAMNSIRHNNTRRQQKCDLCHLKGHTREQCYKLIGYPHDFKFTKNKERDTNNFRGEQQHYNSGNSGGYRDSGNSNGYRDSGNSSVYRGLGFTTEQFQKLLNLIDKQDSPENVANMADLMTSSSILPPSPQNQVHLPNGAMAQITHKGTCQLAKDHDLYTGKVKGIGKVKDGLYILSTNSPLSSTTSNLQNASVCFSTQFASIKSSIWHQRLGHAPVPVLSQRCGVIGKYLKLAACTTCSPNPIVKIN